MLSTHAAGRANQRISDEAQLLYAVQQGRALLTFNARDFIQMDSLWKAAGKRHYGIVVSPRIDDLGELLRRVKGHLDIVTPAQQENVLLWSDLFSSPLPDGSIKILGVKPPVAPPPAADWDTNA